MNNVPHKNDDAEPRLETACLPATPDGIAKAAEFLIFSDSFPRSLHYCAVQIEEFLRRILGETAARPKSDAARAARRLLADLQSLTITNVIDEGLHEFLQEIQTSLDKIGEEVVQTTMFYPAESSTEEQQQQQQQ